MLKIIINSKFVTSHVPKLLGIITMSSNTMSILEDKSHIMSSTFESTSFIMSSTSESTSFITSSTVEGDF